MIGSHYRQPLIWSDRLISQSKKTIENLYSSIEGLDHKIYILDCKPDNKVLKALYDDLNTPKALAEIFSISKRIPKSKNKLELVNKLIGSSNLIGLLNYRTNNKRFLNTLSIDKEKVNELLEKRRIARDNRDYDESDSIRDILLKMGVKISDT